MECKKNRHPEPIKQSVCHAKCYDILSSASHEANCYVAIVCFFFFAGCHSHLSTFLLCTYEAMLCCYFGQMCFEYTHNYRFISIQFARERCFAFKIPKDVHTFEINLFVLFALLEIFFSITRNPMHTAITRTHTYSSIGHRHIHENGGIEHAHGILYTLILVWNGAHHIKYGSSSI